MGFFFGVDQTGTLWNNKFENGKLCRCGKPVVAVDPEALWKQEGYFLFGAHPYTIKISTEDYNGSCHHTRKFC